MQVSELLALLYDQGIKITIVDSKLNAFATKGKIPQAILEEIRNHKEELIEFLGRNRERGTYRTINNVELREFYTLSSAQKRMFVLQQLDLGAVTYNMPFIINLGIEVDKSVVERILRQLILRHESFRTSFDIFRDEPIQTIHDLVNFKIEEFKVNRAEIQSIQNQFIRPFDLSQAPLFRVAMVEVKGEGSLLMLDMHHIISDGVSHSIMDEEYQRLYRGEELPVLKLQYKDYSQWQQSDEYQQKLKGQETFWLKQFEGELPILNLPIDYTRPSVQSNEGAIVSFTLSREETESLKLLAERNGLTLYMSILSGLTILLSKLSGQEDIIVGTPVAGRKHADLGGVVGIFVNTLAIRNAVKGSDRIKDFAARLKQTTLEAYENQDYQFEDIVEKVSVFRDMSRNPLFDVMFNLLNQETYSIDLSSFENQGLIHTQGISKFDLNITAIDYGAQLLLNFEYCTKLFKPESIERYIEYFRRVVACINSMSDSFISEIEILSTEEKHQLLYKFNDTKANYPKDKTIPQLFEEQVERTPNDIAVRCKEEKITFKELNIRSNKLANHLINKGFANNLIAILAERSIEMIVGIFGILKSGNAYLPLDPKQPLERNQKILKDSQTEIVLTNIDGLSLDKTEIIHLKDECISKEYEALKSSTSEGTKLSYVIYTSGSTGVPKGVMVTHEGLVNFVTGISNLVFPNKLGSLLSLTTISFDIFGLELYVPLLNGRTMVMATEEDQVDSEKILSVVQGNDVRILQLTPSRLRLILSDRFSKEIFERIEVLMIGGEEFPSLLLSELRRHYNGYLYNMYGPTETTIWSTYKDLSEDLPLNIGRPIANTEIYILGSQNELQPIGVSGELCIGGDGLASGYLNNPLLTSEKFTLNPLAVGKGMYHTGDLARWLPDGNIEFLGRIDHQVKIRGFRIELGEVENALLKHQGIKESVVIARDDNGDKYLCAYIICNSDIDLDSLRTYLATCLPEYMVPSYIVELKELPLTISGKIDRKLLPSPEIKAGSGYVSPTNEVEETLAKIWSEVLNIPQEEISVMANFFSLGGHSLKATVLAGRIHRGIGVEFPLREIFIHNTIRSQAQWLNTKGKKDFIAIPKTRKRDYYTLSSTQKRMYLLQQLDLDSIVYNMPFVIQLEKGADKTKIAKIFRQLISRHESFHTSIELRDDEPVQVVHSEIEFEIEEITIDKSDSQSIRSKYIKAFDLSKAPLLRVVLVRVVGADVLLFIDMHHIISDGVSHSILEREFQQLSEGEELPPLRLQYKDYSDWQNSKSQQEKKKGYEDYWLNRFAGEIPVLSLPLDYNRPIIQNFEGATVNFVLNKDDTDSIKLFAEKNGLTLYISILSVLNILLAKLAGQEEIIIGTPVAGRNHPDLEQIVGMFVNTLAIKNEVIGSETVQNFLAKLKQTILDAFDNQDYPFEDLVDRITINRDTSRNPVFDVMFNLFNQTDYRGNLSEFDSFKYQHEHGISKFDLTLTAHDLGEKIIFSLEYSTHLFRADTIDRYIIYFKRILNQVVKNSTGKISEIEMLGATEKHQLLYEFNDTERDYPRDKTIQQLFEEQVRRTPNSIALVYNENAMTFNELNNRSNQLAWHLRKKGTLAGDIIGIMIDRSFEMIVGILGIMKAGASYLPIDPEYPSDRKLYIIGESKLKMLLTSQSIPGSTEYNCDFLLLEDEKIYTDDRGNPKIVNQPSDLAYIIYTSGTTGQPKGVMVEHKSIVNTLYFRIKEYNMSEDDKCIQLFSFIFDGFLTSLFTPLLSGAKTVLVSSIYDIELISKTIIKEKISHLISVPTVYKLIFSRDDANYSSVKVVTLAGEAITDDIIELTNKKYPFIELVNEYGPTETSVLTSIFRDQQQHKKISIGKPIHNMQLYIVSSTNLLQPVGVVGELLIGGIGLARGYLNNDNLTKEKFTYFEPATGRMHNEEDKSSTAIRVYRTGDLARWLSDGNIEFLGRIDHQVKIRGLRIELGEIENAILKYESIQECVVIDRDDKGDRYLCAYIVGKKMGDQEDVRDFLSTRLPYYMIPTYFIWLDTLPLTVSGKVDRRLLPEPEKKSMKEYLAPRNKVEEKLAEAWSSVLRVNNIGVNDNFFSLGGDSIKTIQIQARMNRLGYKLNVQDIFINPTISTLAPKITLETKQISQDAISGAFKLTPIQYWFFSDRNSLHHFNQSVLLNSKEYLEENRIKEVFQKLLDHHDALRMICKHNNEEHQLHINEIENTSVSLKTYNLKDDINAAEKLTDYANQIQASIDLEKGPLMRLGLFHLSDGDRLLIVIHHLVIDGISWRIIFEDIETLYGQVKKGDKLLLPLKSNSFRDWSDKLTEYAKNNKLLEEKSYWAHIENEEFLTLKGDIEDESSTNNSLGIQQIAIDKNTTARLLTQTNEAYGTEINDILLMALGYGANKTFGNEKILITLESHGREDIFPNLDISRTIGWFTTAYPVLLDMQYANNLSLQMKHVKESLHQIPNKGIGYGVLKYLTPSELKEDIHFNSKPQIEFNYLGQFDSDVEQMNLFGIAHESGGTEVSPEREINYDFSFNGMIAGGQLNLSVRYRKKYYSERLVSDFLNNYKNSLIEIINHCEDIILSADDRLINDIVIEGVLENSADEMVI